MSRYVDIERLMPMQVENSEVELGILVYDYDAVQYEPFIDIVRCGECEWSKANGTYQWCGRLDSTARITADDFCSYGERKEP